MTAAAATPAAPARRAIDRRAMATLSAGHMLTDVSQGSIPALLPFLISRMHLSYAGASALVLAATISSSVIQPLFGHLSDRRSLPWLMPLGPLLGGVGVGLAANAPSYGLTFAAVVLSGLGVAAFHPEGSRFANYVSGERRGTAMSMFSVGGNIGFALGPVLVTPLVLAFGLSGVLLLIVPTGIMAVVVAHELPRLKRFRAEAASTRVEHASGQDAWGPFTLLGLVIALRSFVYFGFVTFLPLYYIHVLHAGKATGNAALSAMLIGGALGTLIGGRLADRYGRRAVLRASMLLLPPLIVLFLISGTGPAMLVAGLAGAATVATFAVTIVMGQEYLPSRIGVASGVTIGLSIGLGGVGAPLLGVLADAYGLRAVFEALVFFPLAALVLIQLLPERANSVDNVSTQAGERVPTQAGERVPTQAGERVPAQAGERASTARGGELDVPTAASPARRPESAGSPARFGA